MFNRYNKKTMSSNRLTIVYASNIENEAGKEEEEEEKKRMGRKKPEEKKRRKRKNQRIELNVIRMNSQYITRRKEENR